MTDNLVTCRDQLHQIREYLVKIGPERRQKEIAYKKLEEAKAIYSQAQNILSQIEQSKFSSKDIDLINNLVEQIKTVYQKIQSLVTSVDSVSHTLDEPDTKMSQFDLKTAIALLPVMTGQEQVTKQLIDAISLYSSMIDNTSQKLLLNFILKTRLTPSAKLRMKLSYDSVKVLVDDMRKHLLPKRSAEAIQSQLYHSSQGRRSIESFGNEIEELFVNLTIAQSDDDPTKYEILRPINEKTAIKRFADGLSDARLSTIIAARQFSSLPEAIRSALDEDSSSPRHNEVLNFRRSDSYRPNNTSIGYKNSNSRNNKNYQFDKSNNNYSRTRTFVNTGQRGKRTQATGAWNAKRTPYVQHTEHTQQNDTDCVDNSVDTETNNIHDTNITDNQFFRS